LTLVSFEQNRTEHYLVFNKELMNFAAAILLASLSN